MIYGVTDFQKGFSVPPITQNVTQKPLFSDNIANTIVQTENIIDSIFNSTHIPADIKNHALDSLIKKLRTLSIFRERERGLYKLTKTPPKDIKKLKKKKRPTDPLDSDFGLTQLYEGLNYGTPKKIKKKLKKSSPGQKQKEWKNPEKPRLRVNPKKKVLGEGKKFRLIKWPD